MTVHKFFQLQAPLTWYPPHLPAPRTPLTRFGLSRPPPSYLEIYIPSVEKHPRVQALIWAPCHASPAIIAQLSSPNMVLGRFNLGSRSVILGSLYFPHNTNSLIDKLIPENMLSPLSGSALRSAILAGDLNSNSTLWNSLKTCARGELIESFVLPMT